MLSSPDIFYCFGMWLRCNSLRSCRPTIWNTLPQHLQSADTGEQFKHRIKNWLFECAYSRSWYDRRWLKVRCINGRTYLYGWDGRFEPNVLWSHTRAVRRPRSTDLYIYILDTVPPINVVWNHVATDMLATANGGTFISSFASLSSQSR